LNSLSIDTNNFSVPVPKFNDFKVCEIYGYKKDEKNELIVSPPLFVVVVSKRRIRAFLF
jgi:hypothetical protein